MKRLERYRTNQSYVADGTYPAKAGRHVRFQPDATYDFETEVRLEADKGRASSAPTTSLLRYVS